MRAALALTALATCCCTVLPARTPDSPQSTTLMLGPTPYCSAVRIGPSLAATARHCVSGGICGTATDMTGTTVPCYVERLAPDRDLAYIRLAPGSRAGIAQAGPFLEGYEVHQYSIRPQLGAHVAWPPAIRPIFPRLVHGQGGIEILDPTHLVDFPGFCVPGQSGGGLFQRGRLVAVLTGTNGRGQCTATLLE